MDEADRLLSMDFEEAGHKLMKIGIKPGQEIEFVTMIIECCSQERTYKRFFGLLAQRFCYVNRAYQVRLPPGGVGEGRRVREGREGNKWKGNAGINARDCVCCRLHLQWWRRSVHDNGDLQPAHKSLEVLGCQAASPGWS